MEELEASSRNLSDMAVNLEGVRQLSRRFVGHLPAAALAAFSEEAQPETVAEVDLAMTLEKRGSALRAGDVEKSWKKTVLRVQGWVRCTARQVCARCLDPFSTRLEAHVDRLFLPGPDSADVPGQQEMQEDVTCLPDYRLAMAPLVEEELWLTLPMIPLCRETCAGLCAGCGAALNREPCRCEKGEPEGPFAVLKKLKVAG